MRNILKDLKLHDEAEVELAQIFLNYTRENEDLALRFFQEITDAFFRLVQHPKIGVPAAKNFRKIVLTEFPYSIYYKESETAVHVATISHHGRKPGYWMGRI